MIAGSITLNGSKASAKGTPAFGVYGATEAALRSFVRTWTSDLKDRHIRSNVNSSGPTGTRLFDRQTEDAVTLLVSAVPMGCMGGAMKSPTQRCFKFQMTAVLSQLPNCSLIATEEQSDRGPLLCLAT
jgi:NAD(P)-dependent dehydrogenase (short-subunit alcohol dehydrogenase family)